MKITKTSSAFLCLGIMLVVGLTAEEDGTLSRLASVEQADAEKIRQRVETVANLQSDTSTVDASQDFTDHGEVEVVPVVESETAANGSAWPADADSGSAIDSYGGDPSGPGTMPRSGEGEVFDPRVE